MTKDERIILVNFCAFTRAYVEGLETDEVVVADLRTKYEALSDTELERESDWLDDISNK